MSPRLGGFVITYRRPQELARTLETLLGQTRPPESLLVVDNGSSQEAERLVRTFSAQGVRYLEAGSNLGPSGAAALALERLIHEPWDWIYWGDDDDPPRTSDTLERLLGLVAAEESTRIGAVGAVGAPWDWTSGRLRRLADRELEGPLDVDVIAGGSQLILSRAAIRVVGRPTADFFFALEDLELCLRLRRSGYRVLVDGDLMRTYRECTGRLNLEQPRAFRPHEPLSAVWRQYYSTRNYIFMMRETFGRPELARRRAVRVLAKVLTAWTRGPRYGALYSFLQLRAITDGFLGRLGQRVVPMAPPTQTRSHN